MVARFCVALAILLSGRILSAQPSEDPQTQFNRGSAYWYGEGAPQDYVQAANWFRKAAEQGYAEAQYD
ncbi:MAG TPA: SEL1-like repeat protein, partial [Terracidiphilus sp.]